ncbi:MAG: GFA family protein [Lysobacter sp.]
MTTHSGSCHCGRIAFDVEGEIDQALSCNCSICQKRGGLLWFVPRPQFTLKTSADALGTYRFNRRAIDHHFCPSCGIAPFSEGQGPDGSAMTCINVRCIDGIDLDSVKVVEFNGRDL